MVPRTRAVNSPDAPLTAVSHRRNDVVGSLITLETKLIHTNSGNVKTISAVINAATRVVSISSETFSGAALASQSSLAASLATRSTRSRAARGPRGPVTLLHGWAEKLPPAKPGLAPYCAGRHRGSLPCCRKMPRCQWLAAADAHLHDCRRYGLARGRRLAPMTASCLNGYGGGGERRAGPGRNCSRRI